MVNDHEVTTLAIPEVPCPACGGSMSTAWVVGRGNNHYGKKCDACNRAYVQYYNLNAQRFGLRPAALDNQG